MEEGREGREGERERGREMGGEIRITAKASPSLQLTNSLIVGLAASG